MKRIIILSPASGNRSFDTPSRVGRIKKDPAKEGLIDAGSIIASVPRSFGSEGRGRRGSEGSFISL